VSGNDELAGRLGRVLGGQVHGVRLVSGGASRFTSAFDLIRSDGTVRAVVIQQDRGKGISGPGRVRAEVALLRAAGAAGVPVPAVVAHGADDGEGPGDGLGPGWVVTEYLEGETIPRKILRDPEWATARSALTRQCGQALAAIHGIDPGSIEGLPDHDPLEDPLAFLDALGEVRPALEFGARWLQTHRPSATPPVAVHGDFRLGNLLIGPDGLRAVLDWELAHRGDAAEDLAWLCAPAWRFGGTQQVGGFGEVSDLLEAYVAAGGREIDPADLRWWQVYATVKWATICAMQANRPLGTPAGSVEQVAIGRRVCESEWDLFALLGVTPGPGTVMAAMRPSPPPPFGRPTAIELVQSVGAYLDEGVGQEAERGARFTARVARNVLSMVERELHYGAVFGEAHRNRLRRLGYSSDAELSRAIRSGGLDGRAEEVGALLAASARDQLLVANPNYLPGVKR
jgi:aminoglycoside phosphotransferase (APT) family kinase protein